MDYINRNISVNLKKIRLEKGMKLEQVAEQTGVSKSMLAQIERGEANPSIGCLGKIVSGLRIQLETLLRTPIVDVYHIPRKKLIATKELAGKYRIYTYFPYEKERDFEIYGMEIEANSTYYSGPHGEHTMEYVVVHQGELILKVQDESYKVEAGDAFRFNSNKEHWYCNQSKEQLVVTSIFSF